MPFGAEQPYDAFHVAVSKSGKQPYDAAVPGRKAVLIDKFAAPYYDNKYWRRFFRRAPNPQVAWRNLAPISCSIQPRISVLPPTGFTAKISPSPTVLLYPFGWSVWLRLRILGDHTLDQLSALVEHLFAGDAWSAGGLTKSLVQLLDLISTGICQDAFDGPNTDFEETPDRAIVTTVLAKYGLSPAIHGLTTEQEQQIKRIVRPSGAVAKQEIAQMAVPLAEVIDVDYLIADGFGRFIWMNHLLESGSPEDSRNYRWLNCYHANSLVCLLHAWQLAALVSAAAALTTPPPRLTQMVAVAKDQLQNPRFTDASVRAYLQSDEVQRLFPKAFSNRTMSMKSVPFDRRENG